MKRLNKLILAIGLSVAFLVPTVSVQAQPIPNGVDISNNNNVYDWQSVKDSKIQYCYIKATEGVGYKDKLLDSNVQGASSVNLKYGFYCFMSEWSSPSEQAEYFYNSIKDYNYELKPCLDVETNKRNLSAYEISNRVLEFCQRFKELSGQVCTIYTGGFYGRDNLDNRVKDLYTGWIAHYGVDVPMVTGFTISGHQFSENYYINGIGSCDVNNFNILIGLGGSGQNNVPIDTSNQVTYDYNDCDMIQREKAFVSDRCLELQQLLNKVMGANLVEDSIYGTNTHNAVLQYQREHNLQVDGYAGQVTFNSLYSEIAKRSVSTNLRDWQSAYNDSFGVSIDADGINGNQTKGAISKAILKQGNNNPLVGWVQIRVGASVDNNFGNQTKQKLIEWQLNHNISSDGVVGQQTWTKLLQEYYW